MKRFIAVLLFLLLADPLFAAVSQNLVVSTQTPKLSTCTFVQGTDTALTYKTCLTGGTNGTKIRGIIATSNDGSASHVVTVQLSTSTSAHCSPQSNCLGGAAVTVPINAGFASGTPAVNLMSSANWPGLPSDNSGNPFIYLSGNTQTIEVTFATALTASTQVSVSIIAEDF